MLTRGESTSGRHVAVRSLSATLLHPTAGAISLTSATIPAPTARPTLLVAALA